ncbi:hypothetical protein HYQ45_009492 [Verticillium longisporum]|uniref:Uncharacterized protein n=1 Tax=Verticillium longisporum TaxID=100787 RepID=A0A8I2ZLI7_VERLO|nr:hypothetical protein HYQ45_009492 [Verticillium longisporum]
MIPHLDAAEWSRIDTLLRKSLAAREACRANPHNARAVHQAWQPISRILDLFREESFTKTNHLELTDVSPYGQGALTALTDIIWAFSNGPVTEQLDCPQTAVDLYAYFARDLYNVWLQANSRREGGDMARLFRTVTNELADWTLITSDDTARPGLSNSPRRGMAAHAWVLTNSMVLHHSEEVVAAKRLWEERCGVFTVISD